MTQAEVPPGFVELPLLRSSGFDALCGPLWVRTEAGDLLAGFRVEERHCNPAGTCHGGLLATFCDVHMPLSAQFRDRVKALILPTITLSMDYLAPTPQGAWVEARTVILKVTRGTVFANSSVRADGHPVAFARGIFKIPSPGPGAPDHDTGAQLRDMLGVA